MSKPPIRLIELIAQAKGGDSQAMMELIQRLEPLIKKYCYRLGYTFDEDLKQDLIEELIRAIHRYEPYTEWGKKYFEKIIRSMHKKQ